LQKVSPITIPILYAESIANTNTDTFAKSIGDNFTPILLPILLILLLAIRNFTVFESSVCEDYYLVKHDRGSNKYKCNNSMNQLKMEEV